MAELGHDGLREALARERYLADEGLLTAVHLSLVLGRSLLLEGEPGVGKSQLACALAAVLGRELIRLQCYEGLDAGQALYEWDYAKQLLEVRATSDRSDLYSDAYLLERPLLHAVRAGDRAVLLIDEIDRADSEFEAFLLEFLSEFQITIPERGTLRAERPPVVIITSNRTRELHDPLKRRCLYHWIDYPSLEKEVAIVRARAPEAADQLAHEVSALVHGLREMDLYKVPGVAETLDWARSLAALGASRIDASLVDATLGAALKYQEDLERARPAVPELVSKVQQPV